MAVMGGFRSPARVHSAPRLGPIPADRHRPRARPPLPCRPRRDHLRSPGTRNWLAAPHKPPPPREDPDLHDERRDMRRAEGTRPGANPPEASRGRGSETRGSRPEKWCIDHRVIRPQSYPVSDAGRAFSVPWSASGNLTGRTLPRASRAHVAALVGPLLGLLDGERAHEADDRGSTCEDPHHIRAPADLLVQALLKGLVRQRWRQSSSAEVRQGQQVTTGLLEVLAILSQLPSQRRGDPLELKL